MLCHHTRQAHPAKLQDCPVAGPGKLCRFPGEAPDWRLPGRRHSGLYLNFHYDGTMLQCITGTSMHTFTMDKTLEREWDAYVGKMLGNWREL